MQLSKETIATLRNYAGINSSILLKPGNRLSTISDAKHIYSETIVVEEFPVEFGIYDLNEFLSVLSVFKDTQPTLDFNEKYVTISDGFKNKFKYYSAGQSLVKGAPSSIKFPETDISFDLPDSVIDSIKKISNVLKTSDISFIGTSDNELKLVVVDKKNPTANSFESVLDGKTNSVFQANFKVDNLKLYPGSYRVDISSKKISKFTHADPEISTSYYIAIEADSSFS
jgi:hypothetical protein